MKLNTEEVRQIHRDRVWALIMAGVAVIRASSYLARPPLPISEATIFTLLSPTSWAVSLMITAFVLVAGAIRADPRMIMIGSAGWFFAYLIFAWNFTGYVVTDADFGWAGIGLILMGCANALERFVNLGRWVRRWWHDDEVG